MDYRKIIEEAGGIFLSVRGNIVRFQAEPGGATLSLYTHGLRSAVDVALAIKCYREPREYDGWPSAKETFPQ